MRLLVVRLLLICAKLGVSVAGFLTSEAFVPSSTAVEGPLVSAKPVTVKQSVTRKCHKKRRQHAQLLRRARRYLEFALEEDVSPPPTLKVVCHGGGFTKPSLYRRFPDRCRQISARWTVWNQGRETARRERLAHEVCGVATRLHGEGVDPNTLNVARSLSRPGAIRDRAATAALREFRRVLGLDGSDDVQIPAS